MTQTKWKQPKQKPCKSIIYRALKKLRGLDLNQRPSGYEPDELPDCSTPRSRSVANDGKATVGEFVAFATVF